MTEEQRSTFNVSDFLANIQLAEEAKELRDNEERVAEIAIKDSLKKVSPFEYINAINFKKEVDQTDDYNSFIVNKLFSMHADTILNARMMNRLGSVLPNQLQFDYYNNTVRSGKRLWWYKPKTEKQSSEIEIVKELYQVNDDRAYELYELLSESNPKALSDMVQQYRDRIGGR